MLVETAPEPVKDKPKYTSQIRGRIQDQETQITPRRDLILSYFAEVDKDGNQGQVYFAQLLDRFNLRRQQQDKNAPRLLMREQGGTLSSTEVEYVRKHLSQLQEHPEKTAQHAFLKGVDYLLLQDLEAAISSLSEAIDRDPEFALAYFARALASLRRSVAEQGRLAEPQPVPPTPTIRPSATGSAGATPEVASVTPVQTRLVAHSPLTDLRRVIELAPTFAYAYYNLANLYVKSGDTSSAMANYSKAIELNPSFAESYFNRGLLFYSEGKVREGTRDLSRAGELGLYKAYSLIKRMNK